MISDTWLADLVLVCLIVSNQPNTSVSLDVMIRELTCWGIKLSAVIKTSLLFYLYNVNAYYYLAGTPLPPVVTSHSSSPLTTSYRYVNFLPHSPLSPRPHCPCAHPCPQRFRGQVGPILEFLIVTFFITNYLYRLRMTTTTYKLTLLTMCTLQASCRHAAGQAKIPPLV